MKALLKKELRRSAPPIPVSGVASAAGVLLPLAASAAVAVAGGAANTGVTTERGLRGNVNVTCWVKLPPPAPFGDCFLSFPSPPG